MADEPCVLVVEDDAALASMLAGLLAGEGYNVVVAADGQRALHEGLSRHFDVIVMDRGLPAIEWKRLWNGPAATWERNPLVGEPPLSTDFADAVE